MLLLLLACEPTEETAPESLAWERFSADVEGGYIETTVPAGAVWTASCIDEWDIGRPVQDWSHDGDTLGLTCFGLSVEVTWLLPD